MPKTIVDKLDLRNIINIIDTELDKVNDRDNLYNEYYWRIIK